MTCAIIPFGKAALPATSNRYRKNRAAGVPVTIANQASPLEASEGLIAPAGRRPPTPARRHLGRSAACHGFHGRSAPAVPGG